MSGGDSIVKRRPRKTDPDWHRDRSTSFPIATKKCGAYPQLWLRDHLFRHYAEWVDGVGTRGRRTKYRPTRSATHPPIARRTSGAARQTPVAPSTAVPSMRKKSQARGLRLPVAEPKNKNSHANPLTLISKMRTHGCLVGRAVRLRLS